MATNPLTRANGGQYVADFETAATKELLALHPVWCWAVASVEDPHIVCKGRTISEFMGWALSHNNADIYFHNLKFDGEFIVYWLMSNGYKYLENSDYKRKAGGQFFTTVISGMGAWYAIRVHVDKGQEITFKDSLKRVPLKLEQVPKAYGLAICKGVIDYEQFRGPEYVPTAQEWEYVEHDVLVIAQALNILDLEGMEKVTVGSNALAFYKETLAHSSNYQDMRAAWRGMFPTLDAKTDSFCRAAYLGGWVYANPKYTGHQVGAGLVFDVNSMYPGVMRKYPYPYGRPIMRGTGRVPLRYQNSRYVYFQRATFSAVLKPGCPPTLKIRDSVRYYWNRYITDTHYSPRTGAPCNPYVTATLSNVDWEMLLKYYDVTVVSYDAYCVFRARSGLFNEYIDYWTEQKIKAGEQGNTGLRTIAKLYLNNLYGKFGSNPNRTDKHPVYVDGRVIYLTQDSTSEVTGYVPVAALCTSYARREVTTAAHMNYDRFLYADTDSIHLLGVEDPLGMEIDPYALGAWDNEAKFSDAIYLGAKCYAEKINDAWKVTVAGMPNACKENLDVERDFKIGYVAEGKLVPRRYPGGVLLEKTTFEIKER